MKLSKETMEVLKNFATINMSLLIPQGSKLKTITSSKTVLASANVKESFPKEVAIYDMNKFLATASLFDDPDFDFQDKAVRISNGSGVVVNYTYAAKEAIVTPPERDVQFPESSATITVEEKSLLGAIKAAGVLSLPNVAFVGRNGKVYLTATDNNDNSSHTWEQEVGETDSVFKIIFKLDVLKFLPRDYNVSLTSKLITKFESKTGDVVYYVAADSASKFGE